MFLEIIFSLVLTLKAAGLFKYMWPFSGYQTLNGKLFLHQPYKMVKHTKTIRRLFPTNFLSEFDHFVGFALEGLVSNIFSTIHKRLVAGLFITSNIILSCWICQTTGISFSRSSNSKAVWKTISEKIAAKYLWLNVF